MAKFNASGVGGDIRGKLGNSVFSRNKGGAIIRQKVTPNNPQSAKQSAVRQNFGQNSKAWSGTLTDDQRSAWTAFAAANPVSNVFGNSITLTGLAMYNRLNQVLLQIGQPVINDPPVAYSVDQLPAISEILSSNVDPTTYFELETAGGSLATSTNYYVQATAGLAPGKTPNNSLFRYVGKAPASGTVAGTVNLSAEYAAIFGMPATGQKVWANVEQVNTLTGAVLTGIKYSTIVVND